MRSLFHANAGNSVISAEWQHVGRTLKKHTRRDSAFLCMHDLVGVAAMTVASPPMEAVESVVYPYAIASRRSACRAMDEEERSVLRETVEKNLSIDDRRNQ